MAWLAEDSTPLAWAHTLVWDRHSAGRPRAGLSVLIT